MRETDQQVEESTSTCDVQVLIGELGTIDGLKALSVTSFDPKMLYALPLRQYRHHGLRGIMRQSLGMRGYIRTEVTTLDHEVLDNTVEE